MLRIGFHGLALTLAGCALAPSGDAWLACEERSEAPACAPVEEARLLAPDGVPGDRLGHSVALSSDGSRALVGVPNDDTGDTYAGSARVFVRAGMSWAEEAMLLASDGTATDFFGSSVALSADGSRALVGVEGDDTAGGERAGSARVFVRAGTSWTEEATLVASDGAPGDTFGISVALTADASRALVGVYGDDTAGGEDAGSARVFVRAGTSWIEEATLVASDGAPHDRFGRSVALDADGIRALVGVRSDDTAGGEEAGSGRVFVRAGTRWTEEATLLAPGAAALEWLGLSVALSSDGSRALMGAPASPFTGAVGSARVYVRAGTSWAEEAMFVASDGAPYDRFGWSVALSSDGSRALVGATWDRVGGDDTGSVRAFVRAGTGWTHKATLRAWDSAPYEWFGYGVALSSDGRRALVGVPGDDGVGGSARVFLLPAP